MSFNAVSSSSITTLCLSVLISFHAFSQPEEVHADVLELLPMGYVYADYPGVFEDIEDDGLTFEAWIYMTELPKERPNGLVPDGQWLVFAKPGSYYATISARTLTDGFDRTRPEGTVWAQFGISRRWQFGWSAAFVKHEIPPGDFPIGCWVHIAYQIAADRPGVRWTQYFDHQHITPNRTNGPVGFRESPLLIGGIKHLPFEIDTKWFGPAHFESLKGYIDEFRISKGWRYAADGGIRPNRRSQAYASTIALWHFDEGASHLVMPMHRGTAIRSSQAVPFAGHVVDSYGKLAITRGSLRACLKCRL